MALASAGTWVAEIGTHGDRCTALSAMSVLVRLQDPITGATETIAAPWQVISLMQTLAGHGAVCVARERGEAAPQSKRTIAMECEVPVFKSLLRCAHALVAEEHPDVTGLHPELAEAPPLSAYRFAPGFCPSRAAA